MYDENILSSDFTVDERLTVSGLPTTLIVIGLEEQLNKGKIGYTSIDYLSPILEAVALLKQRHKSENDILDSLNSHLEKILNRIVKTIELEWDIDLHQLGLDSDIIDHYIGDVLELYHFFILNRLTYSHEILSEIILSMRKKLFTNYRKSVIKKNQTISEARKFFLNFEDVVVWISIPQVLISLKNESNWGFNLEQSLLLLNIENSAFLSSLLTYWNPDDFIIRYCNSSFTDENILNTELFLQDWWLSITPKKHEFQNTEM
jgi:hypothetical protein